MVSDMTTVFSNKSFRTGISVKFLTFGSVTAILGKSKELILITKLTFMVMSGKQLILKESKDHIGKIVKRLLQERMILLFLDMQHSIQ